MTTYSFFSSATPAHHETNDGSVTVGVLWATNANGTVTGLRFYAPPGFDGTYTAALWNADSSTLLASKAATGVTGDAWNLVTLDTPVSVSTGITYLVGFYTSGGSYSFATSLETTYPYSNGPIYTGGTNAARYAYGAALTLPTNPSDANYHADIVFDDGGAGGTGDLSGSSAATSGATGTLTGDGALSGTSAATSNATGVLTGDGALTGTSAATSNATGTLTGSGALSGTSAATTNTTGTLTGSGALSGASAATTGATGTLTGTGALSGVSAAYSDATGPGTPEPPQGSRETIKSPVRAMMSGVVRDM